MTKTLKFWSGLGVAAVSGTMVAQAAAFGSLPKLAPLPHGKALILVAASGEAGESGHVAGGGTNDRLDYLMDLGLIEGRMLVAAALYGAGDAVNAKAHLTRSTDDGFADLKAHFEDHKVEGFAAELDAVARAVDAGSAIEAPMAALLAKIAASRGGPMTAQEAVQAAVLVLQNAASEFEGAVKNGAVADAHEYQDAWGFVQAARRLLAALSDGERAEHAAALAEIDGYFAALDPVFADFSGKTTKVDDPSIVAGTVARIELAASAIK